MGENVRLVVWDLDDTFWKGTVSEGGIKEYVQAHHDIVIELARRGILSSICTKNDEGTILRILQEKGLLDYFIFPSISWEPKGMRLAQLIETVQLRAPTIMFIDDNPSNRAEAVAMVPSLQVEDETFIPRMLNDPRFQGKDDSELSRLKQYKLLESRKHDEKQAASGNEDFLRGCDVRVYIEHDVDAHIDRAIELINRTNQLNYTKKRLPEDPESARRELREQLQPFDRVAGLVRVADNYGDYGFVGFFMTGGMRTSVVSGAANTHLFHYCFSCRTLGMLIEAWVYEFLGRPELKAVGEVLTDLSIRHQVDWVRQIHGSEVDEVRHEQLAPQLILYGGCEVNAIGAYLRPYTEKLDVYGNYVANGIFVRVNFAGRIIDICDRLSNEIGPELEQLGLPLHLESGDIFASAIAGAVFVVNLSMDAEGGDRLRHRISDWNFVLEPNGLNMEAFYASSEAELSELLEARPVPIPAEQKSLLTRVSKHLQENYERIRTPDEAEISELMRMIIARVPAGSKLIIVADHHMRRDMSSGQLKDLPRIARYRALVEELSAQFPYVTVVSVSEAIESADEVLGGGHYSRGVYLRLSHRIVEAAKQVAPRSGVPLSKRRIARLAAERMTRDREIAGARDFVEATYEVLLRRSPEPGILDRLAPDIAEGRVLSSTHLRNVARSREFASKWQATEPTLQIIQPQLIESVALRIPSDLSANFVPPRRVLIIGSCLSERFQSRLRQLPIPCESSLYFAGTELPNVPERPLVDYDFQLVQLGLRHILPDGVFARLSQSDEAAHERLFNHTVLVMRQHLNYAMRWNREHELLTFVFPFMIPMQNPVGRLLPRYDLRNAAYFIERVNEALSQQLAAYSNVHLLDINEILSYYGRRFSQDDLNTGFNHNSFICNFDAEWDRDRLEHAGQATDIYEERVTEALDAIWRELTGLYSTVRQVEQVKLVVCDLDDTLWRGVIAEGDVATMPTNEGWPKGLWEALLFLKRRGILLAIISKNDESRVIDVWEKIFARRLLIDDFAIRKINWNAKADNMAEILAHVNLLPSSVVYIDDNPAERAAIKSAFPDIRVLGGTPLAWRRILLWSPEMQVARITEESVVRTEMTRAQVTREQQRQTMPRAEFLASLNVTMNVLQVRNADHPRFPRVLELINKTNQFNTTGKRWTREECVVAFANGATFHVFEVADRYTDYGLVGVLIVDSDGIQQFVMSCRVMGLEVEIAAVSHVAAVLRFGDATKIFAALVETERNQPCRNVYSRCGFTATDGGWQRSLNDMLPVPDHISLRIEGMKEAVRAAAIG